MGSKFVMILQSLQITIVVRQKVLGGSQVNKDAAMMKPFCKDKGAGGLIFLAVLGFLAAGVLGVVAYINYSQLKQYREEMDKTETDLRSEGKTLKEQVAQLQEENKKLNKQILDGQMELTKLEVTRDNLQRQLEEQKSRMSELSRKASEIEALKATIAAKEENVKNLEADIRARNEQISKLTTELDGSKEETVRLKEEMKRKEDLEARLKETNNALVQREKEVTSLKEKMRQREEELNKALTEKASGDTKLKSDFAKKEAELNELKKSYEELTQQRDNLLLLLKAKEKEEERFGKEFMEELTISAGPIGTRGEMNVRSSDSTLKGSKVSLTQVLNMGLDNVGAVAEFTGKGRFGFSIDFFEIIYEDSTTLTEEVRFAGVTAKSGDDVNSSFSTIQAGLTLHINLGTIIKSGYKKLEAGVFAGIRYIKYSGEIEDVSSGDVGRESLTSFLPYGGLQLSYHIGTDISLLGKALGCSYTYGYYSAPNFIEASLSFSLKLTRLLRIEAGYKSSNIHIRYEDKDTLDSFRIGHSFEGPFLMFAATF